MISQYTDYYSKHPEQLLPPAQQLALGYERKVNHLNMGQSCDQTEVDLSHEMMPASQSVGLIK